MLFIKRKGWVLTTIKNDYVNGIDNYNKALDRISGSERPSLLRDLAQAYKDIGFFEKAKYYYNEAFALDSNKAENFSCLTILAFVRENLTKEWKSKESTRRWIRHIYPLLWIMLIKIQHIKLHEK